MARRSGPAWLPLAATAIVVPTALAGLTLLWPRPQVEGELTRTGGEALAAAGFPGVGLSFTGRDATVSGVPAADRQRAVDAVQGVTGVRVAGPAGPGSGDGAGTPALAAQPFGVARRGDDVVLTGVVGSEEERAPLVTAARASGKQVVDQLTVTPGTPLPAGVDATSIGPAVAAAAGGPGDLAVAIGPGGITLTGTVADDATETATAQAIGVALPGMTIDNRLVAAAPGGDLDAAAKQKLQASIAALLAGAPITFGPDSPQLTPQGSATVAKVLALLKPAPGARVQIDGFVAGGPGNGKLTAQQLSQQRAGAVRDAFVAGGVPADHITAAGKGEGVTPADRALGRRAAITVV